jgi:hypothetical protein
VPRARDYPDCPDEYQLTRLTVPRACDYPDSPECHLARLTVPRASDYPDCPKCHLTRRSVSQTHDYPDHCRLLHNGVLGYWWQKAINHWCSVNIFNHLTPAPGIYRVYGYCTTGLLNDIMSNQFDPLSDPPKITRQQHFYTSPSQGNEASPCNYKLTFVWFLSGLRPPSILEADPGYHWSRNHCGSQRFNEQLLLRKWPDHCPDKKG